MLTCYAAYEFASKDAPAKFGRLETNLIRGFTPNFIRDENSSWSACLLNYYFCLGMVKLNPAVAICLMEEAGVTGDSIEAALVANKAEAQGRFEFKIYDTHIPVAPPTFSNNPADWLERGYEAKFDFKAGDVCVYEGHVGFYKGSQEDGLYTVAGFMPESVGVGVAEQKLIKIIRV